MSMSNENYENQQYQKGYEDGIKAYTEELLHALNSSEVIVGTQQFIANLANEMLGKVAFKIVYVKDLEEEKKSEEVENKSVKTRGILAKISNAVHKFIGG